MKMRKVLKIIAIICGILFFVFAMALDSESTIPAYICLGSILYLGIYSSIKVSVWGCKQR